ncbi:MAG TPA: DUF456 family protein [Peptococcaceae bacterium]|nr:DUF456 family protein [Peptococcaceae bacterium]
METIALILTFVLFIAGLVGTVLPLLPGAALIYGGMLLYGLLTKFATLDLTFFLLQALVLILIFAVDYLASAAGTRRFGGSKQAAWGAVAGAVVGIFFGPLGIILGPFLGAVAIELIRGTAADKAIRAGFGTIIGILGGTIVKLAIEVLMIIYFFMRIF